MNIEVRLFATLRNGRDKVLRVEPPEGSTVRDIVGSLGIAEDDIAILLVRGHSRPLQSVLRDGDVVSLFPPVGGG